MWQWCLVGRRLPPSPLWTWVGCFGHCGFPAQPDRQSRAPCVGAIVAGGLLWGHFEGPGAGGEATLCPVRWLASRSRGHPCLAHFWRTLDVRWLAEAGTGSPGSGDHLGSWQGPTAGAQRGRQRGWALPRRPDPSDRSRCCWSCCPGTSPCQLAGFLPQPRAPGSWDGGRCSAGCAGEASRRPAPVLPWGLEAVPGGFLLPSPVTPPHVARPGG